VNGGELHWTLDATLEAGEAIPGETYVTGDSDTDDRDSADVNVEARAVSLDLSPERDWVCAGWNTLYDVAIANEDDVAFHDPTVRATLPEHCNIVLEGTGSEWDD